ncbi:restriction endonuclease [Noviherbaspirillum sp. L7-7A]|uniref:restriction endonuclease n=1 Tax=Noviherbaspirillum sp. L7-7A TaxID=2850560 RepID=UPI001C2CAAD5|nr:restriction endonuclease [Noviherbaspirillum sp. L7-7A]MBV0882203.1 restriction endonuclease [Noviherbaspirillum sp. L7-7A]
MPRTKKTSPAEDLLYLIALLPWWAGVGMAIVGYGVLHALAAPGAVPIAQPTQLGQYLGKMLGKTLAYYGQFIVPVICLAGAALSAWRRRQRRALVATVTQNPAAGVLDGLSWEEFERLVGEGFRLQGYRVIETGGSGPDGGVDLVLSKGSETYLVQCKQWKAYKVGVEVVRELYGVMAAKGAAGGFVVTSGQFTEPAREFARGRNLKLVDGQVLLRLLQPVQTARSGNSSAMRAPTIRAAADPYPGIPSCPACAKPMVRRTARRGSQAGNGFWGCARYPV